MQKPLAFLYTNNEIFERGKKEKMPFKIEFKKYLVILKPKKIKSFTVSIVSPSICHGVMGLYVMVLVSFFFFGFSFLNVEF